MASLPRHRARHRRGGTAARRGISQAALRAAALSRIGHSAATCRATALPRFTIRSWSLYTMAMLLCSRKEEPRLERARVVERLGGIGAQCRLPAPELLYVVAVSWAAAHQAGAF